MAIRIGQDPKNEMRFFVEGDEADFVPNGYHYEPPIDCFTSLLVIPGVVTHMRRILLNCARNALSDHDALKWCSGQPRGTLIAK